MPEAIKIIITDDKKIYRDLFKGIVETSNIAVIAQAENGEVLLSQLEIKRPDIILLDIEMPVMDGHTAFGIIRNQYSHIKIILVSLYDQECLIEYYRIGGAKGYIPKDAIMDNTNILIQAIKKIQEGETFFYQAPLEQNKFVRGKFI